MSSVDESIQAILQNPKDVSFGDLCKVCEYYFGEGRQKGSHIIYKTPWQGDPRINIQNDNGKAKAYQVRQVQKAIEKLEAQHGNSISNKK
jgi:hypothetical protein